MQRIVVLALVVWPLLVTAQTSTNICHPVSGALEAGVAFGTVTAGATYSFTATGTVAFDCPGGLYVDADGQPYGATVSPPNLANLVCVGLRPLSLVGKVNGTCVQLGQSGTFVAPATGELRLFMNDVNGGYFNNCGIWSVCVFGTWGGISPTQPTGSGPSLPVTQPPQHPFDITRNSLFWFTHPETGTAACATLYQAIVQNANVVPVGFLEMPTTYRSTNYVLGAEDALIETLGLYWRNASLTGEDRGLQNQHSPASLLCRARKQLAVELIAAIANNVLLGTGPTNATYHTGKTVTNFPANLLEQAGLAAAGVDRQAIVTQTAVLKKFNTSGVTNHFVGGLIECSPWPRKKLRSYGQDPTTKYNCPGRNDICETAESVLFPSSTDIFATAVYTSTVDLRQYTVGPTVTSGCGQSGNGAFWKIAPDVGTTGRGFTVSTDGSNIGTLLSVWSGQCSNTLTEITCSSNTSQFVRSPISFTTDGTNTYYIIGQGYDSTVGRLRIRVTSP